MKDVALVKPIIGLIPLWDDEKDSMWMLKNYMESLEKHGAVGIMFPLTTNKEILDQCFNLVDGILFTGGQDIDPKYFNEELKDTCGKICDKRDAMEEYLFEKSMAADMPILGICRGVQLFNVFLGGTLYQDLPTEKPSDVKHTMSSPYNRGVHDVDILEGTPLHNLLGLNRLSVNSYHHQAIKDLAPGVEVNAVSDDGIVEAITYPAKKFMLGVQWHPEYLYKDCQKQDSIIEWFVKESREYRENK